MAIVIVLAWIWERLVHYLLLSQINQHIEWLRLFKTQQEEEDDDEKTLKWHERTTSGHLAKVFSLHRINNKQNISIHMQIFAI